MREYNPCIGCEYYNKPYWSVVSPCKNCHKTYGYNDYIAATTTNINGLIVDDLVEDLNKFISDNKLTLDKGGEFGSGVRLIGSNYDELIKQGF